MIVLLFMNIKNYSNKLTSINEHFEGTEDECLEWAYARRDEFLELTGFNCWTNGYISLNGSTLADKPRYKSPSDPVKITHKYSFEIHAVEPSKDYMIASFNE